MELLEQPAGGLRHWLVVPRTSALLAAHQVTAVGFFGDLRPGVDHAAIYQLEAEVVGQLPRYAAAGLLAYYDAELDRGTHCTWRYSPHPGCRLSGIVMLFMPARSRWRRITTAASGCTRA